jgi:hypothetical protein
VFVPDRYAIENLALDPAALSVYLLREAVLTASEMSLPSGLRHFEMNEEHIRIACDYVIKRIQKETDSSRVVNARYVDGYSIEVPEFWFEMNGHELEERVMTAFPRLKATGAALKLRVIEKAMSDVPPVIPMAALDLFKRIVAQSNLSGAT